MKNLNLMLAIIFFCTFIASCRENTTLVPIKAQITNTINLSSLQLRGVDFFDSNNGFIVGDSGTIFKTTDGGNSWIFINSINSHGLGAVKILNMNSVFICGIGQIIYSNDGGVNWISAQASDLPGYIMLYSFCFLNNNGWAVGGTMNHNADAPAIFYTTNKGNNWIEKPIFGWNIIDGQLYSVLLLDTSKILISVGKFWPNDTIRIYKSTNSGETFNTVYFNNIRSGIFSMSSYDKNKIFASGWGKILISTNQGDTWSTQIWGGDSIKLNSVFAISNEKAIICGDKGTLLLTNDGGNTWTPISSGTTEDLQCITSPPNSSFAIAVGKHGIVVKISFIQN